MRQVVASITLVVLLSATARCSAKGRAKPTDQRKWARQVMADFFESAAKTPAVAVGLLTPELAKSILADRQAYTFIDKIRRWNYKEWRVTSEEVSPDGTEIIFRGVLKGNKE